VCALLSLIGFFLSLVAAQIYRYFRVSTRVQRQQTKWVVFGVSVSITGLLAILLAASWAEADYGQALWPLVVQAVYHTLGVAIPLSLLAAMLQDRLWAIDVIIRRTLVYAVLTTALALAYFAMVVLLQLGAQAVTGVQNSQLAIVISTLGIAALFSPLRRQVQVVIDRRFYRAKYDAERALALFADTARDDVDLDTLTGRLLGVVDETMQPAAAWLWLAPSAPADQARSWNG
jgi:hypothetical protein